MNDPPVFRALCDSSGDTKFFVQVMVGADFETKQEHEEEAADPLSIEPAIKMEPEATQSSSTVDTGIAKKKIRSDNFTYDDQKHLMACVKKYAAIIECKKTDKFSTTQKNEEWKKLLQDFNSGSKSGPRTVNGLKSKFKNMKNVYRKNKVQERQSQYATGGGPSANIKSYDFQKDMDEVVLLSAEALFNPHDSDRTTEQNESEIDAEYTNYSEGMDMELREDERPIVIAELPVDIIPNPTQNWSCYNVGMLRQPKHVALQKIGQLPSALTSSSCPTPVAVQCSSKQANTSAAYITSPGSTCIKKPTLFKTNKFYRPSLKKYNASKPASAITTKYSLLANSKKKLADLQAELIQKEINMKEEKHEKEKQLLDFKIKGQKLVELQLELVQKEITMKEEVNKREIQLIDLKIENQRLQNKILEQKSHSVLESGVHKF